MNPAAVRALAAAVDPSTDCEAIAATGVAQPVNTVSGVLFVVVAALLVAAARHHRVVNAAYAFALMLIANAVGTVVYHGTPSAVGHWIHDVAIVGLLAAAAGWHLGRLGDRPDDAGPGATTTAGGNRGAWVGAGIGTLVGAVAVAITHSSTMPLVMAAVVAIAVGEVLARRRGLPAAMGWGFATVLALALVSYALGRSESPVCAPDSVLQFHGVWHLLTAVTALVWADRALGPHGPGVGSGVARRIADQVAGALAVVLVRAFHREVDVIDRRHLPSDRPVLFVVNHGNGFVDPMVLAATLRRLPRFIAKAALWKVPPARVALDALAVLPVHRRSDGDDPEGNARTFAATTRALFRRDRVAIFPEGTTGDRAALDTIHTGAARIALGAAAAGVREIAIVPVGLAFESRVATRGRVSVHFGTPIDLDSWRTERAARTADSGVPDDRQLSHELTDVIRTALTEVSPVYASVDEREQLRLAAAVSLRAEHGAVAGFGDIEELASTVARAPEPERHAVVSALARHALRRTMVGLTDADLVPGPLRRGGTRLAVAVAVLAVFGPVLLSATLINLPAVILVQVAVMRVSETATKGTVRLLVGLLAGVLTWWVAAMVMADGVLNVLLTMLGLGVLSAVALAVWGAVLDGVSILRMWFRRRDRVQLVPGLEETAAGVAAAVDAALVAAAARPAAGTAPSRS